MRITSVNNVRNNQIQKNSAMARNVKPNSMNSSGDSFTPSFKGVFAVFVKEGKAIGPEFIDNLKPEEVSEFVKTIRHWGEYEIKDACGCNGILPDAKAFERFNKLKPEIQKLDKTLRELREAREQAPVNSQKRQEVKTQILNLTKDGLKGMDHAKNHPSVISVA